MSNTTEHRLIQLFWREQEEQVLVDINDETVRQRIEDCRNSPEFKKWLATRRIFALEEVADTVWVKTCTAGYITELHLHKDGTAEEYTLFSRKLVPGTWQLTDGQIEVTLAADDHRYRFAVIANAKSSIHAAVEYCDNDIHSYLKIMQLKPL
jgi:hypothetical protein